MSDPVSNTEIEDVLSSIRRLVADDAKAPAPQAAQADRLVLTPSQRIPDASETAVQDEPDLVVEAPESDEALGASLAELVGEEIERALEDVLPSDQDEADEDWAKALSEAVDAPDVAAPEPEHVDAEVEADRILEQKIAALEQLVTQKGDEWEHEADALAEPMFQHNPARALDWKDVPAAEEPAAEEVTESTEQPVDGPELADAEPAPEPAAAPESTVTPFVLHTAPEPEAEPDAPASETVPDLLADNQVALDEEALRDLVGEMVRRELQGALGERITRNVRKLVRREIHRAMVAREFD